jgi:hypothetical protein
MWEPRCLKTLWVSTACYRDSFTHFTFNSSAYTLFPHANISAVLLFQNCDQKVFESNFGSFTAYPGWRWRGHSLVTSPRSVQTNPRTLIYSIHIHFPRSTIFSPDWYTSWLIYMHILGICVILNVLRLIWGRQGTPDYTYLFIFIDGKSRWITERLVSKRNELEGMWIKNIIDKIYLTVPKLARRELIRPRKHLQYPLSRLRMEPGTSRMRVRNVTAWTWRRTCSFKHNVNYRCIWTY